MLSLVNVPHAAVADSSAQEVRSHDEPPGFAGADLLRLKRRQKALLDEVGEKFERIFRIGSKGEQRLDLARRKEAKAAQLAD
jgi:hypothetical protein